MRGAGSIGDMAEDATYEVNADTAGQTLAAALRGWEQNLSWAAAKRLIQTRRVEVNGVLCLNDARRLSADDRVTVLQQPRPPVPSAQSVRVLHVDPDLIVIDKPAGIITLRRDEEAQFTDERKALQPTLDELIPQLLPGGAPKMGRRPGRKGTQKGATLYPVHRLDRDTSGLMIFALSPRARDALIGMFSRHEVRRKYIAIVHGHLKGRHRIESSIIRDRGDGLRGSLERIQELPPDAPRPAPGSPDQSRAQRAVTGVIAREHIGQAFTIVECELETGRTHQIRIHLSELGHMLCGEKLYTRAQAGAAVREDACGAPRQALHSAELRLVHPIIGRPLEFASPLPPDLSRWLERLRREHGPRSA